MFPYAPSCASLCILMHLFLMRWAPRAGGSAAPSRHQRDDAAAVLSPLHRHLFGRAQVGGAALGDGGGGGQGEPRPTAATPVDNPYRSSCKLTPRWVAADQLWRPNPIPALLATRPGQTVAFGPDSITLSVGDLQVTTIREREQGPCHAAPCLVCPACPSHEAHLNWPIS